MIIRDIDTIELIPYIHVVKNVLEIPVGKLTGLDSQTQISTHRIIKQLFSY